MFLVTTVKLNLVKLPLLQFNMVYLHFLNLSESKETTFREHKMSTDPDP